MHYKLMFPNEYVGAHDLQDKDWMVTIKSVSVQELTMAGGKKENKPVVEFEKAKKKWVLNKTNATTIASLYGRDTASWIGKSIILYPTNTKFGRETVECVRVRDYTPDNPVPQTEDTPDAAEYREKDEA